MLVFAAIILFWVERDLNVDVPGYVWAAFWLMMLIRILQVMVEVGKNEIEKKGKR